MFEIRALYKMKRLFKHFSVLHPHPLVYVTAFLKIILAVTTSLAEENNVLRTVVPHVSTGPTVDFSYLELKCFILNLTDLCSLHTMLFIYNRTLIRRNSGTQVAVC